MYVQFDYFIKMHFVEDIIPKCCQNTRGGIMYCKIRARVLRCAGYAAHKVLF